MWRLRECSLNDEQLAAAIGVSSGVIRNRRNKPQSWKQGDIDRLASYFSMSTTASQQLTTTLGELSQQVATLPSAERRRIERALHMKATQLSEYNLSGWTIQYLLRMHQSLSRT
ncbi:hypothetical protein J2I48_24585 [Fibrella sp. HMF5036]|uniref:Uncharacterized protein n=2 Tax=Fibrella aquatilis TaxID=2817059 RepID=A0A939JYP3_9BACT|nr:hypothetical protein [Fibrella aquatilis]